ncbi:MAG: reverse gyrase [Desulfurococcaceae archaeon TW002]
MSELMLMKSLMFSRLNSGRDSIHAELLREEMSRFTEFFSAVTGGKVLWSIQKTWAKRILSGESFALIAPTGVGKSTLLQIYSLYIASKNKPVIYVVPTKYLANQVLRVLNDLNPGDIQVRDSEAIKLNESPSGKRIDVITHALLHRNKKLFEGFRYYLAVIDDFDALLKSSSLMNTILSLVGISEESIKIAQKLVLAKKELLYCKYGGNPEKIEEILKNINELELSLGKSLNYVSVGQILIASATGRGKGERVKVLRELLGFEVGSITDYLRNIVEVIEPLGSVRLEELIKKLHRGTLLFVSKDMGVEKAKEIAAYLANSGVRVLVAGSRRAINKLRENKVDVLVGVSSYYGILTRGLDEPLHVYNTIFYGIPKFKLDLDSTLLNPLTLIKLIKELPAYGYVQQEEDKQLVNKVLSLRPGALKVLTQGLRGIIQLEGFLRDLSIEVLKARERLREAIDDALTKNSGKVVLSSFVIREDEKGKVAVLIPDVMTYLQASGRSSRLYGGHMTLGLSVVLYDDEDLLKIFQRKLRYVLTSYAPVKLGEVDLAEVIEKQQHSRSSSANESVLDKIKSVLIIVESPTKARTIAKMFGVPGKRFIGNYVAYETVITYDGEVFLATIAPSMGHVLDLVNDEGLHGISISGSNISPIYTTIKRCAGCGYQFTEELQTCPRCGSVRLRDSRKVLEALKKIAREVDEVYIATDPDDEGEKIAYDLHAVLSSVNPRIYRIEFHEITKHAVLKALNNPRNIDLLKVSAQIVRRVDDRLVGFELSKILQEDLGKKWLGGGRVQTPVLRWVVERFVEHENSKGYLLRIYLPNNLRIDYFLEDRGEAEELRDEVSRSGVVVHVLETFEKEVSPPPPYSTDTLLTDVVRELRLPPTHAMRVAQDLFESGYITYHRTDSTHVSSLGVDIAREYVERSGLSELFAPRTWGAEGTHECIRPTKPADSIDEDEIFTNKLTHIHKKIYQMIFRRFIASQLKPSRVFYGKIRVCLGNKQVELEIPLKILREGFTRVYSIRTYGDLTGIERYVPTKVEVVSASKVPLLTSADIIRMMKEYRIGRPSTYAKAVENNLRHGYLILSKKKQYLIPTKTGIEVLKYIRERFDVLSNVEFTRHLESLVEGVKSGRISLNAALTYLLSDVIVLRTVREASKTYTEYNEVLA